MHSMEQEINLTLYDACTMTRAQLLDGIASRFDLIDQTITALARHGGEALALFPLPLKFNRDGSIIGADDDMMAGISDIEIALLKTFAQLAFEADGLRDELEERARPN